MKLEERPYHSSHDLARMRELVIVGQQANIAASYMHPGCLDWSTHNPPDEAANRSDLRLWEGVDEAAPGLAAWAIFLRHEGSFDLFVHPAVHGTDTHARVMDAYLAWAEARAREAALEWLWPFWAMDYDTVQLGLMRARGFEVVQVDPPPPLFDRTLETLPEVTLPTGFTVQGVTNAELGQQRARVTHGAFHSKDDWDAYWAKYAQLMGSAVYDGQRDLLVRAPDGRGASACTIWFDSVNAVGLFEPVGTHPDFQGKGLGKAVMAEGLRRMRAAGMQRAIVGFDPNNAPARALYSSLGFRASAYFAVARKAVAAGPAAPAPEQGASPLQ